MSAEAGTVLLLAAVLARRSEAAADRTRFFGAAARGRPDLGEAMAPPIELRLDGHVYRFVVRDLGPDEHLVEVDGVRAAIRVTVREDVWRVDPLGATAQVRPLPDGDGWTVTVDGHAHRVLRDDGEPVAAPAPAVVIATRVHPGQLVEAGEALVVLEAMKMEMTVAAPSAGRVRQVLASVGTQVGTGTPLVRLGPVLDPDGGAAPSGERARFSPLALEPPGDPDGPMTSPCRTTLEDLRRLILGYDVDPAGAASLGKDWRTRCGDGSHEEALRDEEDRILAVFADVVSLDGPFPDDDGKPAGTDLVNYLRSLDARQDSLSPAFVRTLGRALSHHGVHSLDRTPALEEAVWRVYRAWHDSPAPRARSRPSSTGASTLLRAPPTACATRSSGSPGPCGSGTRGSPTWLASCGSGPSTNR